jgi:hypothetical protein
MAEVTTVKVVRAARVLKNAVIFIFARADRVDVVVPVMAVNGLPILCLIVPGQAIAVHVCDVVLRC